MSPISNLQPRLVVDTSTEYLSLAIENQENIYWRHKKVNSQHSDFIIPFIADLLKEAHLSIQDIKLIGYVAGPGSFTGLRIGLSVIKGLALPQNIPLVAIPTLDYIAYQAKGTCTHSTIISIMDARMNEVFIAQYQPTPFKKTKQDFILHINSEEFQKLITQDNTLFIGNINIKGQSTHHSLVYQMPKADLLLNMLNNLDYPITSAQNASLMYLRNKVALTHKEQILNAK